ncbi:MAG TPA: AMP-dependent synthetase, partial [Clostridiales bacterium]|nr:AMP-dependent synthetase [Clostridiales bacterium]
MIITEVLEKNAKLYPHEVSLVEINPAVRPDPTITWREYSLIETAPGEKYRREMTWKEFDIKANRFANLLLTRGIKKGDKV